MRICSEVRCLDSARCVGSAPPAKSLGVRILGFSGSFVGELSAVVEVSVSTSTSMLCKPSFVTDGDLVVALSYCSPSNAAGKTQPQSHEPNRPRRGSVCLCSTATPLGVLAEFESSIAAGRLADRPCE